jgi:RNA polymerase sigma factor (sigma-70 family)
MDFDTLYERYARDVYRFALYLSGRPHEADDITAETFVRAWTSGQPIRVGTVKAYLFMIARNLYRAGLRERGRTAALDETVRDPRPGPEASAASRLTLEAVLARMQALPGDVSRQPARLVLANCENTANTKITLTVREIAPTAAVTATRASAPGPG